ncbi:uncharacterized protein KGF55_004171 [Candida pseudojiufengensis]|uniref:uncharacterized protein n=1 Tax=Candida pseudojiufengensis TaxID=497109 RepID=UPI0022254E6B|nr:uncharacterized protein KGF55_004171 [Candida pseudojiufengensis]KAI5961246.1 hypothetical protein KGF55_004171 [Candida pseudojiufengensis]
MKAADEKLYFKNHFYKLGQGRIISNDDYPFWSKFWRLPTTSDDIYEIITLEDLKLVQNQNLQNYYTFVKVLSLKIIQFTKQQNEFNDSDINKLLNCIRFLCKIIPPLFALDTYKDIEIELFWDEQGNKSLAYNLMMSLVDLLFTKGFTINSKEKGGLSLSVWEPGIGYNAKFQQPNLIIDSNRSEVLKLIICLCSTTMYYKASTAVSTGSKFLTILVSATPKKNLLTLVSSLINLVCRSSRSSINENALYYDNINFTEIRHLCATQAFQLLTLMIVYPLPENSTELNDGVKPMNLARAYMGKIHKENEILFLVTSLINILRYPMVNSEDSTFGIIKNVNQPSLWAVESVILIWELIQCNKHFKEVLTKKFISEFMVILLYYIFAFHNHYNHKNLVRVCSYLLLFLSSNCSMLENLFLPMNSMLYESIPASFKLSITPLTTRDYLVCQICTVLLNAYPLQQSYMTKPLPNLLLSTLAETLFNLIPPVSSQELKVHNDPQKKINNPNPRGGLSYQSSSLIIQLIARFSNKSFLLEKSFHLNVVALIIRAVCTAVIKYPQPSRMLLFCILKNEKIFDELWNTIFSFNEVYVRGEAIAKIVEQEEEVQTNVTADTNSITIKPKNFEDNESVISEAESVEASLRPKPPSGMSTKAKEKRRKESPIGKSWEGKDSLALIITTIVPYLKTILNSIWSGTRGSSVDSFELVRKIEHADYHQLIEEHKHQIKSDLLPDTKLEQLKFNWSYISLGWYLSLLYGKIYNTTTEVKVYIGNNNKFIKNFSNSIATVSKITSSWTSFLKQDTQPVTDEKTAEWIKNSITNFNPWQGTDIKLFELQNESNDSFFANLNKISGNSHYAVPGTPGSINDMMKKFNELKVNGKTSPPSTPTEDQDSYFGKRSGRNSVTSLHSLNTLNRIRSHNTPRNSIS